jgi:hypothetical protein
VAGCAAGGCGAGGCGAGRDDTAGNGAGAKGTDRNGAPRPADRLAGPAKRCTGLMDCAAPPDGGAAETTMAEVEVAAEVAPVEVAAVEVAPVEVAAVQAAAVEDVELAEATGPIGASGAVTGDGSPPVGFDSAESATLAAPSNGASASGTCPSLANDDIVCWAPPSGSGWLASGTTCSVSRWSGATTPDTDPSTTCRETVGTPPLPVVIGGAGATGLVAMTGNGC